MDISKVIRSFIPIFFASVFTFNVSSAEKCETIRFNHGESSGTFDGIATPEDMKCYRMATDRGQTASLRVMAGNNIIFTIDGVVDAQDSYTFTTDKKTYKIYIGQLMRSVTNQPFTLFVSIK